MVPAVDANDHMTQTETKVVLAHMMARQAHSVFSLLPSSSALYRRASSHAEAPNGTIAKNTKNSATKKNQHHDSVKPSSACFIRS